MLNIWEAFVAYQKRYYDRATATAKTRENLSMRNILVLQVDSMLVMFL